MNITFASNKFFDTHRVETKNGREYLVVNGVPLVEGVLNKRFVSAEQFGAFLNDWNDLPLVLPHPKQNGGSARVPNPDVPVVGRFYNANLDGNKLIGEYWLDKQLLEGAGATGKEILEAIQKNKMVETSTGYWSESLPEVGKFNGTDYDLVDKNIHPDHIALLPNESGACSIKDGCGLNRNNLEICMNCEHSQNLNAEIIQRIEKIEDAIKQNIITGSLPPEGKKIYEAVYKSYKEKEMSDEEAAKRAWGAVKQAGWYREKDGTWKKKDTKQNQQDSIEELENLAVVMLFNS
jgi:hypothetical protein